MQKSFWRRVVSKVRQLFEIEEPSQRRADIRKLQILNHLRVLERASAPELSRALDVRVRAISHLLGQLESDGLVEWAGLNIYNGREYAFYRLADARAIRDLTYSLAGRIAPPEE